MKLKNILFASILGAGLLFIVSCDPDPDPDPVLTDCEKTTYDSEVKAILDKSCNTTGCHDGAAGSLRKPMTDFGEASAIGGGIMKRAVTDKDMPPAVKNPLSDADIATLKCWLDNGKKEN